jgi:glycosyltransferase 2 family protein
MTSKKIISIIILTLTIVLAGYFIKNNLNDFKQLTIINPIYISIFIALLLLIYFIIGLITKAILKPLNVNLSKKEAFQVSVMTGFYNLITPFRGGLASRAVYLKKKYEFPYTTFLSTVAASYIIEFFIASLAGIIATYLIYLATGLFSIILFFIFLGMFLAMSFIIIFSPTIKERKKPWLDRFIRVINGWHILKRNKKLLIHVSFLTFIKLLIASILLLLQFKAFGMNITYLKTIFLTAIGNLGILISITPANLGISEFITVFSALTIGITAVESLSASILGRLLVAIVLFILGPIFSYYLIKGKKNEINNKK